jgi:aspartate kinase
MNPNIKVFKFGGASVKHEGAIRNIPGILSDYPDKGVVIILSAMDKTTNHLEDLVRDFYHGKSTATDKLNSIMAFHQNIAGSLFGKKDHPGNKALKVLFRELENIINTGREKAFGKRHDYDFVYDQVVPYGELFSTTIVSYYLNDQGMNNHWHDVRQLIKADDSYRSGQVDWEWTRSLINEVVRPVIGSGIHFLTQGFIAGNQDARSVTLGREGSDYSASIFAYALDASEVVFWKDVPGLMNADPKDFGNTSMLNHISYSEAIELAYYGAKVIHPKTIKPLQNKSIPLKIKSFIAPADQGSLISRETSKDSSIPSFIIKGKQVLISFSPKDHSFIAEEILHYILGIFIKYKVSLNLMQTSAITFSVCVDRADHLGSIMKELEDRYYIRFNENLRLITIRHYNQEVIERMIRGKEVLLEQRSRSTVQYVVKA